MQETAKLTRRPPIPEPTVKIPRIDMRDDHAVAGIEQLIVLGPLAATPHLDSEVLCI